MPQETMTPKQKRMMEAARLRHMEDMSNREISKHIGVTEGTVENYFSDPEMQEFKRFYSDQELFKLQQSLEQDIQDGNKLANNLLARAIQHDEAKPSTLVRAAKEAQKIRQRKVDMLQELGILEKPTEKKKVESEADTDELRQELVEGLKEKREELVN
jgi:DNA-binding transcriptional regulator LsrR (DeoR family)